MTINRIYYLLIILCFIGCTEDLTKPELESITTSPGVRYKAAADDITGIYNVLGFGYDATDPYLEYTYSKLQVIDVKKLVKERSYENFIGKPLANRTTIVAGSDGLDFATEISNKFTGTVPVEAVTLGIRGDITANYKITSKYSYATCYSNIYMKHMKLYSSQDILNNYLTPGFVIAINTLSCDEIIRRYGTHVYTDIFTGGRLQVDYKSTVNTDNKKLVVNAGASVAVGKVFNLSADNHADLSLNTSNSSYVCNYKTDGGDPGHSCIGVITDATVPVNINTWSNTVNESNSVLIEIGDKSLIPIYEFITDATKKAELKTAVNNYVSSKGFTILPVVPLYRYCNNNTSNHFYTINANELGFNNSTWRYEGIAAYVSETQQAGMVPFYRFYKAIQIFLGPRYLDHYYTRDYASGINNGFTHEKTYYVYPTQVEGTVPLKQYYNSSKRDHFYCINPSSESLSGFSYNGDCCYVYPGTR